MLGAWEIIVIARCLDLLPTLPDVDVLSSERLEPILEAA